MQKVSNTYKESMKSNLRERGYIMISFGLVNQEAQANASVDDGDFTYYSAKENIFTERTESEVYATLEQDFTKVDGSMLFLPRESEGMTYLDTGIVSGNLVSDENFKITISLNIEPTDFKGLTVNFGENYPVDFDLVSEDTGKTIEFRGNTDSKWYTEEVLEDTTAISLVFYTMKIPQTRVRIYSIMFGYGLVYYNDSVTASSLESYVSPIGEDVPQIDFSVTLTNYDKYFNVDNPDSAINYLETGQEMDVMYGYKHPDSGYVEWIQGNHLLCSEWESDDTSATIKCQDVFRNMDTEFTTGIYSAEGKSYYDLAVEVLELAGITDYYIDPLLKELYTNNPMPRVTCKEALQIIANACRCVLMQNRYGQVQIRSNFMPDMTVTTNGETYFSQSANVLDDSAKDEYATLSTNYTPVNGSMFFLPQSVEENSLLHTGYVSSEISDENGEFAENPKVTVKMEAVRSYYGLKLQFGRGLPAEFVVRTYNEGELVNEYTITQDYISETPGILEDFDDCNEFELEFVKTAEPYNRITLNWFSLDDVTDFTMTRQDMTSSPTAIKQELVKDVTVVCYSYQESGTEDTLVSEDVDVTEGEEMTYYVSDPCYGYSVFLDESEGLADIVAWGNYFITLRYKVTGSYKLEIQGYKYTVTEKYVTNSLHARGKTVKWENPLISNTTMANDLCEWLSEYYMSGIEYEYDTRGNPELDANDIIYQENDFVENMKVTVYKHTINFNQAFSGSVTARRNGG